jgi:NAD(P)-dependent dehydrogenase (short-subunit alcohol dehydrogenase family)
MPSVVITGAGRGIGRALVERFARAGWSVIGTLRPGADAGDLGSIARVLPLDVTDTASANALGAALAQETIDVLINNAGIIGPERQSASDMDFDGFLATLDVNVVGPLRVTQALLPVLKRSAAPKVAVISSQMGSSAYPATPSRIAYCASKSGANRVVQGLAAGLKREGIAVLSLHPGWVRTDMGGSTADIAPEASADGIFQRILELDLATTGRFLNYDGSSRPW